MNRNERNKHYYYKKREQLINFLGGKCVRCGETNHMLLEFDHIDPFMKSMDVSSHITSSNVIQTEIHKLQLLCKECHKIKSREDNSISKMCGENNPLSKLTNDQVIEIRKKYSPCTYSYNMLASEYGVSKTAIIEIVKNRIRTLM